MLDEAKTDLRDEKKVLRSKTPDLVRQEFYGLMLTHAAIRRLMYEAAEHSRQLTEDLSFVHAVRVLRRRLPEAAAIPPWFCRLSQSTVVTYVAPLTEYSGRVEKRYQTHNKGWRLH